MTLYYQANFDERRGLHPRLIAHPIHINAPQRAWLKFENALKLKHSPTRNAVFGSVRGTRYDATRVRNTNSTGLFAVVASKLLPQKPGTSPATTSGLTALPPFSTLSTARLQALYSDFSR